MVSWYSKHMNSPPTLLGQMGSFAGFYCMPLASFCEHSNVRLVVSCHRKKGTSLSLWHVLDYNSRAQKLAKQREIEDIVLPWIAVGSSCVNGSVLHWSVVWPCWKLLNLSFSFFFFFYQYSLSSNVIIGYLNLSDRFEISQKYSSDVNV